MVRELFYIPYIFVSTLGLIFEINILVFVFVCASAGTRGI